VLQLIAKRHASAHIIAFVAGPCALARKDVPGLASRLRGTRLDIVVLASAAEVGSSSMQALQSLVDCLNGVSSASVEPCSSIFQPADASQSGAASGSRLRTDGVEACNQATCAFGVTSAGSEAAESTKERASRVLFVQAPQESMEVWEQMEPLMEMLEGSGRSGEFASSANAEAPSLTDPVLGSSPNPEQLPASESNQLGTSLASSRPTLNANATQTWQQQQVSHDA
jgi:hypothetical protein